MTKERRGILALGDHIEMEHERELPGLWNFIRLWEMHRDMHIRSDHWDHSHPRHLSR